MLLELHRGDQMGHEGIFERGQNRRLGKWSGR